MKDEIPACPECDSARLSNRVSGGWRCKECSASFEDAHWRTRKGTGSQQGLAYQLVQADSLDDLEVESA